MGNNKNSVELIGTYGGDLTHALSAWTSTARDLADEKLERVDKLLKMLASNEHETPFEKSAIHFIVTTDVSTHIHLLKHRIGVSINAESARYKELKDDKFYVPNDWDLEDQTEYIEFLEGAIEKYHKVYARLLEKGFSKKRAKESSRFYLPYGNQLTADVMFNFRSFYHFVKLRYSMHAQVEIRQIAREMLECVQASGQFTKTLEAFDLTKNGILRGAFE